MVAWLEIAYPNGELVWTGTTLIVGESFTDNATTPVAAFKVGEAMPSDAETVNEVVVVEPAGTKFSIGLKTSWRMAACACDAVPVNRYSPPD